MSEETISCEEAVRLLAAFLDGELDAPDRDAAQRHLEVCRSCFSRAEFERRLKERFAELRASEPDPRFRSRIQSLIRAFGPPTDVNAASD